MHPDGLNLGDFKLWLFDLTPTLGWKEIGIGKSEFVAKTQFLYIAEKTKICLNIIKMNT